MRPATVGLNMTVADAQAAIPRDAARCMPSGTPPVSIELKADNLKRIAKSSKAVTRRVDELVQAMPPNLDSFRALK